MKRIFYLDWLRVIAIIGVICIHASSNAVEGLSKSCVPYLINCFGRFAVPVFVMMSGVLFLNRNISIKKLYSKYILKYAVCIFIFYILNILISYFHLKYIFITQKHIWFLYMIIGIYMVYPFLKMIIASDKLSLYFVALSVIYAFIMPLFIIIIDHFSGNKYINFIEYNLNYYIGNSNIYLPLGFSAYFILGYLCHKFNLKENLYLYTYVGLILSFALITYLTYYFSFSINKFIEVFLSKNIFVLIFAVSMFMFFKYNKLFNTENKIIYFLSKYTFCIYLIHAIILKYLKFTEKLVNIDYKSNLIIVLNIIITYGLSLLFAMIIKKIPVLNKYFI